MKKSINFVKLLRSRFFITAGIIVLIISIWNIVVVLNNNGIIRGRVVDINGEGVRGVTVSLVEMKSGGFEKPVIVETDIDGNFLFEDLSLIEFIIDLEKEGYLEIEKTRYHLYFKKQNFTIPEPFILEKDKS